MLNNSFHLKLWLKISLIVFFYAIWSTVVTAQIRVINPAKLAEKFLDGTIQGTIASFGTPLWGEQIVGQLFYGESNPGGHCNANDYEIPRRSDSISLPREDQHFFSRIVVVKRGSCHFVTKVLVAQTYKDADAVIVIDDHDTDTRIGAEETIMADDGLGRAVIIPSILINKSDGEKLIDAIKQHEPVIVKTLWAMPEKDYIYIEHWMSPAFLASNNFLTQFAPIAKKLKTHIHFTPHQVVMGLSENYNSMCLDSDAEFCSSQPDWDNPNSFTGKNMVEESARRLCLWKVTASEFSDMESKRYSELWWNYVEKFDQKCFRTQPSIKSLKKKLSKIDNLLEKCSYDFMTELQAPIKKIKACVENSSELLAIEKVNRAWSSTALLINDARYTGPLDAHFVTRAICNTFDTELDVCTELKKNNYNIPNEINKVPYKRNVVWLIYLLITLISFCIILIVFILYRQIIAKRSRSQSKYEVFEDNKPQASTLETPQQIDQAENLGNNQSEVKS